jgi:hypothetical protein
MTEPKVVRCGYCGLYDCRCDASELRAERDALSTEVEKLREALEGTIDPDTGHYWECIAGQRGHGQCSQLCERLRRALEEKP